MSEKYTGGEYRKEKDYVYRVIDQDGIIWGLWEGARAVWDAGNFADAARSYIPKEAGVTLHVEQAKAFLVADEWEVVDA